MPPKTISINRAPVLILWATVVAQHLGFHEDEALSVAKALTGLNAQTKGRRLGIYKPHEEGAKKAREKKRGEEFWIKLMGRPIPAKNTEDGIRAVKGAEVIDPESVRRYLQIKFGESLGAARSAMEVLARSYKPNFTSDFDPRFLLESKDGVPRESWTWV
jgi:hypothetical protein